mmetsp:Transcript_4514/g.3793  ORF Transcript_4514/g.3793 Transcript_4514/m.3793 type:complete len:196 (+) Transcript_4514:761-1348(+)
MGEEKYKDIQYKLEKSKLLSNRKSRDTKNKAHANSEFERQISKTTEKEDTEDNPQKQLPTQRSNDRFISYKGKLADRYTQFGGLGANKDIKWNDAYKRRKNMVNFGDKINESLHTKGLVMKPMNILTQSGMSTNSEILTMKARRENALIYAKKIKKPKHNNHNHTTVEPYEDERFDGLDNNQYLLENQKIKMLFG